MSTILKNPLTDHLSFLSDGLCHLRSNRTSKSDRLLADRSSVAEDRPDVVFTERSNAKAGFSLIVFSTQAWDRLVNVDATARADAAKPAGYVDGATDIVDTDSQFAGQPQGESFLGRKWLIGKKIKKELDKPEGISHAKMV